MEPNDVTLEYELAKVKKGQWSQKFQLKLIAVHWNDKDYELAKVKKPAEPPERKTRHWH